MAADPTGRWRVVEGLGLFQDFFLCSPYRDFMKTRKTFHNLPQRHSIDSTRPKKGELFV